MAAPWPVLPAKTQTHGQSMQAAPGLTPGQTELQASRSAQPFHQTTALEKSVSCSLNTSSPPRAHPRHNLYWDLSDLDGVGGGLVGSPFHNENVKATPYSNGTGLNGCHQIRCPQGKLCRAAYDTPNDVDTRVSVFLSS
jgi:hypothetical protein